LALSRKRKPVLGREDRGNGSARRGILDQRCDGLTRVRREGRDVDQPCDDRVVAGFRDDHPAVGVADQNHRAILLRQGQARHAHVIGQGGRGILDDADVEPLLLQPSIHAEPARTVHEPAMDEDDVLDAVGVAADIPWLLSQALRDGMMPVHHRSRCQLAQEKQPDGRRRAPPQAPPHSFLRHPRHRKLPRHNRGRHRPHRDGGRGLGRPPDNRRMALRLPQVIGR
jgi:hypothetical protein